MNIEEEIHNLFVEYTENNGDTYLLCLFYSDLIQILNKQNKNNGK